MLIANGSPNNRDYVWKQRVLVEKGKTYEFSAWFMAAVSYGTFKDDIEYSVNETAITGAYDKTENGWERYYGRYTATASGEIEIKIRTKSEAAGGNDFAIDDISLSVLSAYTGSGEAVHASIGREAFSGCTNLSSVIIGSGIVSFGNNAFARCYSLAFVTSLITNPFSFGENVFGNYNARLYVPEGTKELYRNTPCWNKFARIYTIDSDEERQELLSLISDIYDQLYNLYSDYFDLEQAEAINEILGNTELPDLLAGWYAFLRGLEERLKVLWSNVDQAGIDDMDSLWDEAWSLQQDVNSLAAELTVWEESIKAQLVNRIQEELAGINARLQSIKAEIDDNVSELHWMQDMIGTDYYFTLRPTDEFYARLIHSIESTEHDKDRCLEIVDQLSLFGNGVTVSTIRQAVTLYIDCVSLKEALEVLESHVADSRDKNAIVRDALESLEVNFPDEGLAYTIRPTNLDKELQLGYKSGNGFVLTSGGMMWFEQKKDADFYLRDADGNYIVATSGNTTLRTGTREEATVWTGESVGGGNYTFFSKTWNRYLGNNGIDMNNAIIVSTNAYRWTITESKLDELQAFLNMLAEEEEVIGIEGIDHSPVIIEHAYDLQGRKIKDVQHAKGIYIINNKKYIKYLK